MRYLYFCLKNLKKLLKVLNNILRPFLYMETVAFRKQFLYLDTVSWTRKLERLLKEPQNLEGFRPFQRGRGDFLVALNGAEIQLMKCSLGKMQNMSPFLYNNYAIMLLFFSSKYSKGSGAEVLQ